MGTFDIKYLDDDHEWVLIACDADLQECVDISRSSGSNVVRLLVHDIMPNLGSSCESSGEWSELGCKYIKTSKTILVVLGFLSMWSVGFGYVRSSVIVESFLFNCIHLVSLRK